MVVSYILANVDVLERLHLHFANHIEPSPASFPQSSPPPQKTQKMDVSPTSPHITFVLKDMHMVGGEGVSTHFGYLMFYQEPYESIALSYLQNIPLQSVYLSKIKRILHS